MYRILVSNLLKPLALVCFCNESYIVIVFFLQAVYLFGFGIPLFIDSSDHSHRMKWSLWVIHRLVLTAVYGLIMFMYHSKWRERLPGKFV
jgi:hypothetical protein